MEINYLEILRSQLDPNKNNVISCEPFMCYYFKEGIITDSDIFKKDPALFHEMDKSILECCFENAPKFNQLSRADRIKLVKDFWVFPQNHIDSLIKSVLGYKYDIDSGKTDFNITHSDTIFKSYEIDIKVYSPEYLCIGLDREKIFCLEGGILTTHRINSNLRIKQTN